MPLSLPETGHDENDSKNNQEDPRDEQQPSAWQQKREQCRADERSRRQNEGFHQATGCQTSDEAPGRSNLTPELVARPGEPQGPPRRPERLRCGVGSGRVLVPADRMIRARVSTGRSLFTRT